MKKKVLLGLTLFTAVFLISFVTFMVYEAKNKPAGQPKQQPIVVHENPVPTEPEKPQVDLRGVHPLLNVFGLVMGGIIDGQWVKDTDMAKRIMGVEKYSVYAENNLIGEAIGSKPEKRNYFSGDIGYRINFKGNNPYSDREKFRLSADWNALPRVPRTETKNLDKYNAAVRSILDKSMAYYDQQVIVIKEVKRVDLDGDGNEETLINATNFKPEVQDKNENGDVNVYQGIYSMIILQKNIKGKDTNIVVAQRLNDGHLLELPFIADVDGDGQMEFMVQDIYALIVPVEGWATVDEYIYKLKDNDVEKMSHIFHHPI